MEKGAEHMDTIEHYFLLKSILLYASIGLSVMFFIYWIAWNIVRDIRYKRMMKKTDKLRKDTNK